MKTFIIPNYGRIVKYYQLFFMAPISLVLIIHEFSMNTHLNWPKLTQQLNYLNQ